MPMESLALLGLCSAPRAKVSSLPLTQSPCLSLSLCISDSFLYPLGSLEPLLTSHLSRSAPPHQPPWYSPSTPDIVTLQGLCICSALHPSRTPLPPILPMRVSFSFLGSQFMCCLHQEEAVTFSSTVSLYHGTLPVFLEFLCACLFLFPTLVLGTMSLVGTC